MENKYDIKKLGDAVYDFNRVTGISITVYDPDGKVITARGASVTPYCGLIGMRKDGICARSNRSLIKKCRESKETVRHICGAGLVDIAIPILHLGEISGIVMIGQIRNSEVLNTGISFSPEDGARIEECYRSLPIYNEDMIESVINIATMLTKYIMLESMVRAKPKHSAAAVADYIDTHIKERITVDSLSRGMHMSPSGIYKCMRVGFGCTPGEYIRSVRIERSLELLSDDRLSIEAVASSVGFSDPAYYSRCFKEIYGISPLNYRKRMLGLS